MIKKLFVYALGMAVAWSCIATTLKLHPNAFRITEKVEKYQTQIENHHLEVDLLDHKPHQTSPTILSNTSKYDPQTHLKQFSVLSQNSRVLAGSSSESESHGSEEESHSSGGHHEGLTVGQYIILFIISGVFVGAVLTEVKKKTKIPYSPMIMLLGIAVGLLEDQIWIFGEAAQVVNGIDPHTLLLIFIPGLIFEGAYNANGYVLGRSKWQVLLMAGPGVLVTSFILAIALQYLFFYSEEISLAQSLVIGSIISTTDPVAVVALLKELGTSIKFNTLLEGESLLNDGTAFVFFLVCIDIVKEGKIDWGASVIKFFQMSFGGPLFGLAVGFFAAMWINRIMKDDTLIIIITVVSTYLTFFFSEVYLHVSGVLALVALGLYLGTFGRVHFNHEIEHAVHTVWGFGSYVLESLIFLITGTFIGEMLNKFGSEGLGLEIDDVWRAVLFYFFVMFVRYVVMMVQWPLLNLIGYKVTKTAALILSFGGLRGAIALSLGMIVYLDEDFVKDDAEHRKFRVVCIFYVFVIIIMTVVVNGLTIKFLMKATGFLNEEEIKLKIKANILRQFMLKSMHKESSMKEEKKYTGVRWGDVEKLVHIENFKLLKKINLLQDKLTNKSKTGGSNGNLGESGVPEKKQSVLKNTQSQQNMNKKGSNEDAGSFGGPKKKIKKSNTEHLDNQTPAILLNNQQMTRVDKNGLLARDEEATPINPGRIHVDTPAFNALSKKFNRQQTFNNEKELETLFEKVDPKLIKKEIRYRIYKLTKHHVFEKHDHHECRDDVVRALSTLCSICADHIHQDICFAEFADTFIGVHYGFKLQLKLSKLPLIGRVFLANLTNLIFFEYQFLETLISCEHELLEEIGHIQSNLQYKKELDDIREEILIDTDKLMIKQDNLVVQFSSLIEFIRTKMAAYMLVNYQKQLVNSYDHLGMIEENEKLNWLAKLDKKIVEVNRYQPNGAGVEFDEKLSTFVLEFPIFNCLNEKELGFVTEAQVDKQFKKGGK